MTTQTSVSNAPITHTPEYSTFLDFRALVLRAIARAWSKPSYWEKLQYAPRTVFAELGYPFPYDIDLEIDSHSAEYRPDLAGDWLCHKFATLTLVLPPAPENPADRAVALADYNYENLTFLRKVS